MSLEWVDFFIWTQFRRLSSQVLEGSRGLVRRCFLNMIQNSFSWISINFAYVLAHSHITIFSVALEHKAAAGCTCCCRRVPPAGLPNPLPSHPSIISLSCPSLSLPSKHLPPLLVTATKLPVCLLWLCFIFAANIWLCLLAAGLPDDNTCCRCSAQYCYR